MTKTKFSADLNRPAEIVNSQGAVMTKAKIRGLDSIRFICALMVAIYHIGIPPIFGDPPAGLRHVLAGAYRQFFNGPPAVIVFFVISGFCIHYPHRDGKALMLSSFYSRRLIRIGLPLLAVVALSEYAGVQRQAMELGIVWSLIAEIIYYLLYPLLLVLYRRFGWPRMIGAAFALASAVVLLLPDSTIQVSGVYAAKGDYANYGSALNWVIGLPCWLLGCRLAERCDRLPSTNLGNIWLYRGAVILAVYLAAILRWHLPGISIGFPWSLNVFALLVYFWLAQEIIFSRTHAPIPALERAGAWSYSLYLAHLPLAFIAARLFSFPHGNGSETISSDLATIGFALLGSYLCFLAIERPSHRLAVRVSARLKEWQVASAGA